MTPEQVVAIAPDRSVMRHALFVRYVLGENWLTAVTIAARSKGERLSSDDMRYIAAHWEPS